MSEMIERVARAIGEKFAPAVNMNVPYAKVMLDMAARAAIEAMREPTDKMYNAAAYILTAQSGVYDPEVVWKDMIDEALK